MSAAGRASEHNPGGVLQPRRTASFGGFKRKVPATESQRANGAMRMWAGGYSSERLWGAGLQVPKRNESGQRPLSSPLLLPSTPPIRKANAESALPAPARSPDSEVSRVTGTGS